MCKIGLSRKENDWIFGFGTTHHSLNFFGGDSISQLFFFTSLILTRNRGESDAHSFAEVKLEVKK